MPVVAVYSVKGGVGKTTIAANIAWSAARSGRGRTLLWDLDPSGGAAFLFGLEPPRKAKAANLFEKGDLSRLVRSSSIDNLDILPADQSLRDLEARLVALGKKKRLARLAEAFSGDYPLIILDCPPVLNETSAQILRAADIVVVPVPPSALSFRALETIEAELAENHARPPVLLPVLSMFDARRKLHKELRSERAEWPVIPLASLIEQGAERRLPLGAFAPSSPAARAFDTLWQALAGELDRLA